MERSVQGRALIRGPPPGYMDERGEASVEIYAYKISQVLTIKAKQTLKYIFFRLNTEHSNFLANKYFANNSNT